MKYLNSSNNRKGFPLNLSKMNDIVLELSVIGYFVLSANVLLRIASTIQEATDILNWWHFSQNAPLYAMNV